MQQPDSPSIEPSGPVKERRTLESSARAVADSDNLKMVHLSAVRDWLQYRGLDVDDEGFIVTMGTGEYAQPYAFDEDRFRDSDTPADNVFVEYFVPAVGWDNGWTVTPRSRLHLTDLHSLTRDGEGNWYPVADDVSAIERLHLDTGLGFTLVTAWSDVVHRAHGEGLLDYVEIEIEARMWDETDALPILNCLAPDCEHSSPADQWNGDMDDPICPECAGTWDENITFCMGCDEWHWGHHIPGETIYAEPVCPHCEADMRQLKHKTRYDDDISLS